MKNNVFDEVRTVYIFPVFESIHNTQLLLKLNKTFRNLLLFSAVIRLHI